MKTRIFIALISCFIIVKTSNGQIWIWAKQAGGNNLDKSDIQLLCIDGGGNTYFAGIFYSNPCYFQTDTLVPNGIYDFYIAKYDAGGNEVWVKSFGGNNTTLMQQESIHSINYCKNSNVLIISGAYYGTAEFGNDTLTGSPVGNFIFSMDTSGSFNWVKQANNLQLLTSDENGVIYAQHFFSTPGSIDTFAVTPGIWLAKYGENGNFLWAKKKFNTSFTTVGVDAYFSKIISKTNKIYGIGFCFVDTFTVDTITVFANFSSGQYIIGCFDTSGTTLWVKSCSGQNSHSTCDIDVDNANNTYITGPFNHSAIFEQDTLYSNNGVASDFFIAKYDSSGNNIWAQQGHSSYQTSVAYSLTLDNTNGFYITGFMKDSVTFGNDTIVSGAIGDLFVARYDSGGGCTGVRHLSNASGKAIVCDSNGHIYVTGSFSSTASFGPITLTSLGQSDIFVAKRDAIAGIEEIGERRSNQLLIYANPTTGKCNVTIPDEFKQERKLTLLIFDNSGKLIQQVPVELNEDKVRINLEAEAKGVYNVTLSDGRKSYSGKIVFE